MAGFDPKWIVRNLLNMPGLVLGLLFLAVFSIGFGMVYVNALTNPEMMPSGTLSRVMMSEATNMLLLAGLYAVTFLSVAMGALLGADTLSGEINSGTIQTIATKPVRRAEVVLGRWLGLRFCLGCIPCSCRAGRSSAFGCNRVTCRRICCWVFR